MNELFELGKKLCQEYEEDEDYSVDYDYIVNLTYEQEENVLNGFIAQRKTIFPNDSEYEHGETFWSMVVELQSQQ